MVSPKDRVPALPLPLLRGADSLDFLFYSDRGTVQWSDAFVFAPAIGGEYEIYLCAATCDDRLESDALTLSVLDHSQSTITGTPLDTVSEQSVAVTLDAGFAYYVEVSAYQTADNYRLVIVPAVD